MRRAMKYAPSPNAHVPLSKAGTGDATAPFDGHQPPGTCSRHHPKRMLDWRRRLALVVSEKGEFFAPLPAQGVAFVGVAEASSRQRWIITVRPMRSGSQVT
jgi:hypothetical protein